MKGRALLLVLSVFVAAVGTGLIYAYVHGADTRANEGKVTVRIAYAQKEIPTGTSLADAAREYLAFRPVNQASMVSGALTENELGTLQKMTTRRAITKIHKNDAVLLELFQDSKSTNPANAASSSNVAMTVQVEGAAAGVGLLQVGQPTIVFVTIKGKNPMTRVLLPKAIVISLNGLSGDDESGDGSSGSSGSAQPAGSQGTVGLSVPLEDARKVVLAQNFTDKLPLYFGYPGTATAANPEVNIKQLQAAVKQ